MGHNDHSDDYSLELPKEAFEPNSRLFEPIDEWIQGAPEDEQIEAMRRWFYARYEDPANQTPYDSEVGFIFVYGGPYDPNDVIQERFDDYVPYKVMEKLIDELVGEAGDEWAPIEPEEDYEEDFALAVSDRDAPSKYLRDRLVEIEACVAEAQGPAQLICQMAHGSLIAALEAYLADTVTYWLKENEHSRRRFVSSNPDFKERKLSLNQLFDRLDKLDDETEQYLQTLMWHRLDKVKPLIQSALNIKLPDIDELMSEVVIRHDIVHRAGRTRDGVRLELSSNDVRRVSRLVSGFVDSIEAELLKRFPRGAESHPF